MDVLQPRVQQAAGAGGGGGGSGGSKLDEVRQQYLEVQQHAAAVQLLNRSLAVAHLRAELVKPRGGALAGLPHTARATIKVEPGLPATDAGAQQQQQQQQQLPWHVPRQPPACAAGASLRTIAVKVSSTPEQLQLPPQADPPAQPPRSQQEGGGARAGPRRTQLRSRQLVHRAPDPQAAARFQADELEPCEGGGDAAVAGAVAPHAAPAARRAVADPALLAQQLSGWVRLGPDGAPEAGLLAGEGGAAATAHQEGGGAELAAGGEQQEQEDLMDEEEWV